MNDDLEQRVAELENTCLRLEACLVVQVQATGTLLALLEQQSPAPTRAQLRRRYRQTVRREIENFLRTVADDAPHRASQLRALLSRQLDV